MNFVTRDAEEYVRRSTRRDHGRDTSKAMIALQNFRAAMRRHLTTATTFAATLRSTGSRTPSASPASCPPTSAPCSARAWGPFRWVALSGDPQGHLPVTDQVVRETLPRGQEGALPAGSSSWQAKRCAFQGLPSAHLLAGLRRARSRLGLAFNELVRHGPRSRRRIVDRPRPPRLRLVSPPPTGRPRACKDGSDADGRLAAS